MEDFINYANSHNNRQNKNSNQNNSFYSNMNGGKGTPYSNKPNNKQNNFNGISPELIDLVTKISQNFDGKNQSELVKAIYEEAKKGKMRGTLTNNDIDNFVAMLYPMLDDSKRKYLFKIADQLKRI